MTTVSSVIAGLPQTRREQQDDGPQHHPGGVTANVAGLDQAQDRADPARAVPYSVHRSVDDPGINAAPQHGAGAFDQGLDHGGVVGFVDEVFVVDQRVKAAQGFGE